MVSIVSTHTSISSIRSIVPKFHHVVSCMMFEFLFIESRRLRNKKWVIGCPIPSLNGA